MNNNILARKQKYYLMGTILFIYSLFDKSKINKKNTKVYNKFGENSKTKIY